MEAGHVGRAASDGVELLSAVDAREVTVLRDVHTDADDIVLSQHVLVVAGGVLPLIEERVRRLHRILGGTVGAPLIAEVLAVVVGNVLTGVGRVTAVELADAEVLVVRVVVEVVAIRHVLAPRASVGGHRIRNNQLGQASVCSVGVHLLNDEGLDDARLGGVVDLGPVNPVEATARGISRGRSLTGGRGGLKGALLRSLECGLRIGEGSSQLGLTGGVQGGSRRVTRGRGGVARQKRIVFSGDAAFRPRQGVAERVAGRRISLSEGGDDDEGSRDRGCSEDHGRVCTSELERH